MIAGTIWTQLVTTLKESKTLKYMEMVFEGRRFDIEPESLPCIMLEPFGNNEVLHLNNVKNVYFDVDIYAFTSSNYTSQTKTIISDEVYRGILDIENDIRAVLQSSNTLGDIIIDTRFEQGTRFDVAEVTKYPVRGLLMPVRFLYRQTDGI